MSFDQDPNEQANISSADFAIMCDEMKQLRARIAELEQASRARVEPDARRIALEVELQTVLQDVHMFAGRLRNISKLHSDQLADYCKRKGYKPDFLRESAPS